MVSLKNIGALISFESLLHYEFMNLSLQILYENIEEKKCLFVLNEFICVVLGYTLVRVP